jgi:hypothetical protein
MAPDIYQLDDEGFNKTNESDVTDSARAEACRGALACPEGATSLVGDDGAPLTEQQLRLVAGLGRQ